MKETRKTITALCLTAAICGCGNANLAKAPTPVYSAAQFYETTDYGLTVPGGYVFSPDGAQILMSSSATGVLNCYALPVSGGEPQQLTDSDDNSMFGLSWFPADRRILFTYDSGGNELHHVVVRELDGGYHDLTPGENLKASFLGWSDDGEWFYLLTTERDQRSFDLYRYSADDYQREMVFENPGIPIIALSGNERWLLLNKFRTSADSDIYLVDLDTDDKEPVLITEHQGNVQHRALGFSPESRHVLYSTDEFGEFSQVWKYELATGEKTLLVAEDWDVWTVDFSPGGRYQVNTVNADARTVVTMIDTTTGKAVDMPGLPPGDLSYLRFSADESRLALVVDADNSPSNIFTVNLQAGKSTRLTNALNPAIDEAHLVKSEVVRYASFDGLEIPALLYKPLDATASEPVPALVWVHGGPGGQSRTGYRASIQHLVNHGYAILAANNRGSSGYGKTFYHLDDRRHGEEDLQDIVYARRYLESLEWVRADRIGIIGGSYGGYMVAAALAFEPDAFDVGINIFGVTNWVRTLENIPPWWEDYKDALYDEMGDPAVDAERHRRISPLFHADNIVRPMLVVQGANDPRVLQVESDELVAAVRANEVPVEYVVFPDEGHGFRKRVNRIAASEAYLKFLNAYLSPAD